MFIPIKYSLEFAQGHVEQLKQPRVTFAQIV